MAQRQIRSENLNPPRTTIRKFDRPTCNALKADILAALQSVAAKHGLTVKSGGGKYDDVNYTAHVVFGVADTDAKSEHEQTEFRKWCGLFDLTPEHYLATFTSKGETFALHGFAPSRPKFPMRCTRLSDGTEMVFKETIRPLLKIAAVAKAA